VKGMSGEAEEEERRRLNRMIAEELQALSRKLKEKAEELEKRGEYEKAVTAHFLAGYLKGAADMWME